MRTYDVLFMADHFVMVTTVQMNPATDKRDIEDVAWKRLADEYGSEWADSCKSFVNHVSIEDQGTSAPTPGDITDTGTESEE